MCGRQRRTKEARDKEEEEEERKRLDVNADADYRDNARDIYPSINSSREFRENPSVPHRKEEGKVFCFCFFCVSVLFRLHQVQPDESIRQ